MGERKLGLIVGFTGIATVAAGAILGALAGAVLALLGIIGLVIGITSQTEHGLRQFADCLHASRALALNALIAFVALGALVVWASSHNDGASLTDVVPGVVVFSAILLADGRLTELRSPTSPPRWVTRRLRNR